MTLMSMVFAAVAFVYASVGHGGASGYLAVSALLGQPTGSMATGALLLNLLVAGTSWATFWRAEHGSWNLLVPFLIGSVPAAFIGGMLPVSAHIYRGLLGLTLFAAAFRLCVPAMQDADQPRPPSMRVAVPVGAGLGLISGIVGVGGGIFLSPLLLLFGWADTKRTAATSAGFIVINSASGLLGRILGGQCAVGPMGQLAIAACIGGIIGSSLGAKRFSSVWLRRILAGVLVMAGWKMTTPAFGHAAGAALTGAAAVLVCGAMAWSIARRPRYSHG